MELPLDYVGSYSSLRGFGQNLQNQQNQQSLGADKIRFGILSILSILSYRMMKILSKKI